MKEPQENRPLQLNKNLTDLFEQVHRDPELKRRLLHDPAALAKERALEFSPEEIDHLKKLGGLMDLAEDINFGRLYPRPPIFYPIQMLQVEELLKIITQLLPGTLGPGPVFYPAGPWVFRRPGWIRYPTDDPTVGGGPRGPWGGGGPGPVFYPASLINFMKERLFQIFQIRQR